MCAGNASAQGVTRGFSKRLSIPSGKASQLKETTSDCYVSDSCGVGGARLEQRVAATELSLNQKLTWTRPDDLAKRNFQCSAANMEGRTQIRHTRLAAVCVELFQRCFYENFGS